jgi:putative DNA primase/helicase
LSAETGNSKIGVKNTRRNGLFSIDDGFRSSGRLDGGDGRDRTCDPALGDYHKTSPIETFTASAADRHPTDLAGSRGARLVTSVETEEGRRWAESKIKSLTGGDRISARFMRQDFFEFTPIIKLVVAGNHKPGL